MHRTAVILLTVGSLIALAGGTGARGAPGAHPAASRAPARVRSTDFNGDGYSDLAIGIRQEDIGTLNAAGAVEVMYGTAQGLQADAPDDQFWNADSPGVKGTAQDGALWGRSLAGGDFDNDGYADLAIGIRAYDIGSIVNAGAVEVLYGSAQGLQADARDDQLWTQGADGVKGPAQSYGHFGRYISAGDFNADGFKDVAIGADGRDVGGVKDAGAVSVLYGSASGLQADAPDDQLWTQGSNGMKDAAERADFVGRWVASGDYNADGYDDLAVGVSHEDVGSLADAGAVAVLYGSPAGLQADGPDDQFWTGDSPGVKAGTEAQAEFGRPVGAGDFNDDGYDDLALGITSQDAGSIVDAGALEVLHGSPSGLQADAPDDQFWTGDSPSVKAGSQPSVHFGWEVSAADFDHDGFDDLAIGIRSQKVAGLVDAGAAEVLYGSPAGLQADAPDDQLWTQDAPGVRGKVEAGDEFGYSLGTDDYNKDGFDDAAMDVRGQKANRLEFAGAVQILYGSAAGLQGVSPDDQLWNEDSPGMNADGAEAGDKFGWGLT
jgi:FG-GAP repeat protein